MAVVNSRIASQQSSGVAAKPFAQFYIEMYMVSEASGLLLVWKLAEVAAKPFANFYNEI